MDSSRPPRKREDGLHMDPGKLKIASLVVLTLQTTALVLLMRYTLSPKDKSTPLYLAATAVFCAEVCKVVTCFVAVFIQNQCSFRDTIRELNIELFSAPMELLKLVIPSGLYTLQNNLLYVALANLNAATFQITYQFKILTTAMFMVLLLHKQITKKQWLALIILSVGIAFIQLDPSLNSKSTKPTEQTNRSPLLGLAAVIAASVSSGFAGVYFEKLMKNTSPSIWIRNIQLGFWGCILSLIAIFVTSSEAVYLRGFFQGFNLNVALVIALQSFGGLCIAVVIKYADNILKVFATSISIILSCFASYYLLHDFQPTWYFAVGTTGVLVATALYNLGGEQRPPPLPTSYLPENPVPRGIPSSSSSSSSHPGS